ncbi:MAG: MBL fold metallo-hydrolase, partial [Bacteroidota bacterium]
GFRNTFGRRMASVDGRALPLFVKMMLGLKDNRPPKVRMLSTSDLQAPGAGVRVTWLGHASTVIQTPQHTILTDPVFSKRASPVPFAGPARLVEPPIRIEDLPAPDLVLLSHDHYDHLDKDAVRRIADLHDPLFVCPLKVGAILQGWGIRRTVDFDWWQFAHLEGLTLHCTPARHFSGRSLFNRDSTLWSGWYLDFDDAPTVYFAGDSGYTTQFREVRERLGAPDVALIPVGAYRPRWMMEPVHVDPPEAFQVFEEVEAGLMIPIHWGTFDLAEEPVQEPIDVLETLAADAGRSDHLRVLEVGGSLELARGSAGSSVP